MNGYWVPLTGFHLLSYHYGFHLIASFHSIQSTFHSYSFHFKPQFPSFIFFSVRTEPMNLKGITISQHHCKSQDLDENINKGYNAQLRKRRICQNTLNVGPGHQDNHSALVLGWTLLDGAYPFFKLFFLNSNEQEPSPFHNCLIQENATTDGSWTSQNPSHGMFINRIRDRKPFVEGDCKQ